MTVYERFQAFISNIILTDAQREDGTTKHRGVRSCLNSHYYNSTSTWENSLLVGSWGKSTEIRPPRDIDVLYVLPYEVYQRFEKRPGNKQSQLLQEVKVVLEATYPLTNMRADGQVVVVPFYSYNIEVVPAFKLQNAQYWICNTNGGGSYKLIDPNSEITNVKLSNEATNGNTRNLIQIMKRWQDYCNVPLKSFWVELLAIDFLSSWQYKTNGYTYYDWMVRDFLVFLIGKTNSFVIVPGIHDIIGLGSAWKSRAESARDRAIKAIEHEANNHGYLAGDEWQKIFGTDIPKG